jgi:hypothetical protein
LGGLLTQLEIAFDSVIDFVVKIYLFIVSILWGYRWGYLAEGVKNINCVSNV